MGYPHHNLFHDCSFPISRLCSWIPSFHLRDESLCVVTVLDLIFKSPSRPTDSSDCLMLKSSKCCTAFSPFSFCFFFRRFFKFLPMETNYQTIGIFRKLDVSLVFVEEIYRRTKGCFSFIPPILTFLGRFLTCRSCALMAFNSRHNENTDEILSAGASNPVEGHSMVYFSRVFISICAWCWVLIYIYTSGASTSQAFPNTSLGIWLDNRRRHRSGRL